MEPTLCNIICFVDKLCNIIFFEVIMMCVVYENKCHCT